MDWMYLFYFLLAAALFFGARLCPRGEWNEDSTSLAQTKYLRGAMALFIALHHMAQKTCAPWHPQKVTVHGLDVFVPIGYLFVAVFLFCSGLGLYKSWRDRPNYLRGFVRRRILPIVVAYYLSEVIYLIVRAAMGEPMNAKVVLWYLSGLHMANFNAWYVIVIPFFYLAFYAAFRLCRRDGAAILLVTVFTLLYTLAGACIDHQSDWWMRGEWWYNSILLFPLGLLFGKYEARLTRFFRRGYWLWLALAFAAIFALFRVSTLATDSWWGYYGDTWPDPFKIWHRLGCAAVQWSVCVAFVAFCFLLMMKLRLGSRVLALLGSASLEFYLMHGIFVELFGYNFLDITDSIVYIRSVPLFIAVVLACSIPATLLFRLLLKRILRLPFLRPRQECPPSAEQSAA